MIKNMWSTPMGFGKMPEEFSHELANTVMQIGDRNILNNILEFDHDIIRKFKSDYVVPSFNNFLKNSLGKCITEWGGGYRLHGWTVSYNADTSMDLHNHRGSQLSAIFYLMCGNAGGVVRFTDPRFNANRGYDPSFVEWFQPIDYAPSSGDIVVFPSFVYHSVSTYRDNVRIAIPVDLFLYTGKNT